MADEPTNLASEFVPLLQAMINDGVDVSDENAVREWLAAKGLAEDDLDEDLEDLEDLEAEDYEEVSLKEAFGLPDRLPPLRLPPDDELAAAARASELLGRARRLAAWVGAGAGAGREVTEDGEPPAADCVAMAGALGVAAPEEVTQLADLPELAHLWDLAESIDLIDVDDHRAVTGSAMSAWSDGDDDDVLDVWATALAVVMTSLDLDVHLYADDELDFTGAGGLVVMTLFLARGEGLPYAELSELVDEFSVVTDDWLRDHGQPVDALLARLADLGAVSVDEEVVRLTPLASWAVLAELQASDVAIDVLPPVAEMTAEDLVAAAPGMTETELDLESSAWLALRSAGDAADQLLEVAAAGSPADRMFATSIVTQLGSAADPLWGKALDDPALRSYARMALKLEPEPEDIAWMVTDLFAAWARPGADDQDEVAPDEVAARLSQSVPAGKEPDLFEVMWRLPHPSVGQVLTLLGNHPDSEVAKAARKAAFKAHSHSR